MMASIIEMVVYMTMNLLIVKLVYFRKTATPIIQKKDSDSWKSAFDSMTIMETRLLQLQDRDSRHQQRIWVLEDTNRDLQDRLARCTKELLLTCPPCDSGPTPLDDHDEDEHEDEDDIANSIPRNS